MDIGLLLVSVSCLLLLTVLITDACLLRLLKESAEAHFRGALCTRMLFLEGMQDVGCDSSAAATASTQDFGFRLSACAKQLQLALRGSTELNSRP